MKKLYYIIILLSFVVAANLWSQSMIEKFAFLEGDWKIEGKELYESWERTDSVTISGAGYKIVEGKKQVHETLTLKFSDSSVVYVAQVPDQNDGKEIPFTLNSSIKDYYSFENLSHDFPQKIQYNIQNEDTVLVNVLGPDDKGFSLKLIRQ